MVCAKALLEPMLTWFDPKICCFSFKGHFKKKTAIVCFQESPTNPPVKEHKRKHKHKKKHKKHKRHKEGRHRRSRRSLRYDNYSDEVSEEEEEEYSLLEHRSQRKRKQISYKFEEYDNLIKTAIKDGEIEGEEEEEYGECKGQAWCLTQDGCHFPYNIFMTENIWI